MSAETSERGGAAPEYGPLGLNHTLRISGVGYFYNPSTDLWDKGSCPPDYDYGAFHNLPLAMNADSIHAAMLQGHRVLPWTEVAR